MENQNKKPGNPQAFPLSYGQDQDGFPNCSEGMTLRDYFAAKAMQGYLSNPELLKKESIEDMTVLSEKSFLVANEMLKQREK